MAIYTCGVSLPKRYWGKDIDVSKLYRSKVKGSNLLNESELVLNENEEPLVAPKLFNDADEETVLNQKPGDPESPLVMPKMDFSKPLENKKKKKESIENEENESEETPLIAPKCVGN